MSDLFQTVSESNDAYTAKDIEVLEGLEPVRRRPGMYVGGTDEKALHHLVAELLDNAMDEAVAGHATRIEIELEPGNRLTVRDNGRGIPVDPHPKFKDKSALEVIFTTLHSGAKFANKAYATAGGLHGVGVSVVNALAETLAVEVARDRHLWRQQFAKGTPQGPLEDLGAVQNRRGTTVTFVPDATIFGHAGFRPAILYRMARSKAYLFKGVEIRWRCAPELIGESEREVCPPQATLHYPGGLRDALQAQLAERKTITPEPFAGQAEFPDGAGRVEWAVTWPADEEGFASSYCNTVPTPQGGTHEAGLRNALLRGIKTYGEIVSNKKAQQVTGEDLLGGACALLSVFIREPQFQGQTKERLATAEAQRLVETAVKDYFDHWLAAHPERSRALLERVVERAEERQRKRKEKELKRQSATRRLRLPGKLADCSRNRSDGTEVFLVEGDSAGGSAKQARNRETQAVLPLRGKILNVASASVDKLRANQELNDIIQALGTDTRGKFDVDKLRYERIIIMCDADVDGAHIASLLMTFFYREMPGLIESGRLYLAQPPLYRLSQGGQVVYARDDAHKEELLDSHFKGRGKVEVSRFKGLGEMPPAQLKATTMNPEKRTLLRVTIADHESPDPQVDQREAAQIVERLMGRKPEMRFAFIQERAKFLDEDALDV
ncbi:DNA topoisomerase IV subunit B [Ferruginivarius sediminum]|uniref:DNA topoisomerase 4 subunit B n=1 Tax=Ferruginivarius sediminum TaxID=2661937 RepID=A0A369T8H9_9PROT|nr:DNA topoisomerase IV subunit B [Ferruginivarius sediminum]RDD60774.1 DNA topoisomerase IV subunit B [Ferruginivarius sediminum]